MAVKGILSQVAYQGLCGKVKACKHAPKPLQSLSEELEKKLAFSIDKSDSIAEVTLMAIAVKMLYSMLNVPEEVYKLRAEQHEFQGPLKMFEAARNHQKFINDSISQHYVSIQPSLENFMQDLCGNTIELRTKMSALKKNHEIFKETDGQKETYCDFMEKLDNLFDKSVLVNSFKCWSEIAQQQKAGFLKLQLKAETMIKQALDQKVILRQVDKCKMSSKHNFLNYLSLQRLKYMLLKLQMHLYCDNLAKDNEDLGEILESEILSYLQLISQVKSIIDLIDSSGSTTKTPEFWQNSSKRYYVGQNSFYRELQL